VLYFCVKERELCPKWAKSGGTALFCVLKSQDVFFVFVRDFTFSLARDDIDYRRAGARSRREMHEMKRKPYLCKRAHT